MEFKTNTEAALWMDAISGMFRNPGYVGSAGIVMMFKHADEAVLAWRARVPEPEVAEEVLPPEIAGEEVH